MKPFFLNVIHVEVKTSPGGGSGIITKSLGSKTFKIKVYTIAVGNLKANIDPVDESTLRMIAEQSKGRFYRATDQQTLKKIFQEIDIMEKSRKLKVKDVKHQSAAIVFYQLAFFLFFINLLLKIIGISNTLED